MVVQRDADDGVDENLELGVVRNLVRKGGVEGVDAFHQKHCAVFYLERLAVVLAQAGDEIVFRHAYLLAGQQLH